MNDGPFSARAPAHTAPVVSARIAPLAKARRVALIEREVRERLGGAAIDLLLGGAQVLAEGHRPPGRSVYYGTVMLTIDVAALAGGLRGAEDPVAAARRAAELMARDLRVDRRVRRLARDAAERKLGGRLTETTTELRVRAQAGKIFIDVDLEGVLA